MKYKGKIDFRVGILKRLWKGLKKSKSFLVQKIIKKLKKEEEGDGKKESRIETLRAVRSDQIKILSMIILRVLYEQELESHYVQIEQEVFLKLN